MDAILNANTVDDKVDVTNFYVDYARNIPMSPCKLTEKLTLIFHNNNGSTQLLNWIDSGTLKIVSYNCLL